MKNTINYITGLLVSGVLFTACSQEQTQPTLEAMLKDSKQQEKLLAIMAEDHDLSDRYINEMMENDHATGMMVDQLVVAASKDSVLAGKLSNMITKYPDLMLLTTHHFMPVINASEHMCDGFCHQSMEHPNIAEGMCHEIKTQGEMSCCN